MAEFQLFAWRAADFHDPCNALIGGCTLGDAPIELLSGSEPLLLSVNDGSGHVSADTAPVLAAYAKFPNTIYPKGAKIKVVWEFEFADGSKDNVFVCKFDAEVSVGKNQSELFLLSTKHLSANQTYNVAAIAASDDAQTATTSFSRGTLIDTPHGPQPVERLEAGDEVLTRNGGIQLISHNHLQRLSGLELLLVPHLRPVCIQAGALVGGLPGKDLTVTQQHRLLLEDWRAGYLFGEDEILVPAKSILNGRNVTIECPETGIDYFDVGLEQQELISANGLWAESCGPENSGQHDQPSAHTVDKLPPDAKLYRYLSDRYDHSTPAIPHASATSLAA